MQRSVSQRSSGPSAGLAASRRCRASTFCCACGVSGGNAPVGRIDHERGAAALHAARAALEEGVVVGAHLAGPRRPIGVRLLDALLVPRRRLFGREDGLGAQLRRALQQRERGVGPGALEVGVAPRQAGRVARLRLDGRGHQQQHPGGPAQSGEGSARHRCPPFPPPREARQKTLARRIHPALHSRRPSIRAGSTAVTSTSDMHMRTSRLPFS